MGIMEQRLKELFNKFNVSSPPEAAAILVLAIVMDEFHQTIKKYAEESRHGLSKFTTSGLSTEIFERVHNPERKDQK